MTNNTISNASVPGRTHPHNASATGQEHHKATKGAVSGKPVAHRPAESPQTVTKSATNRANTSVAGGRGNHHQSATKHPSGPGAGQAPQQPSEPRRPNAPGAGQGISQRPATQGSSTTAGHSSAFEFEVAPPPKIWEGYKNCPTSKIFTT